MTMFLLGNIGKDIQFMCSDSTALMMNRHWPVKGTVQVRDDILPTSYKALDWSVDRGLHLPPNTISFLENRFCYIDSYKFTTKFSGRYRDSLSFLLPCFLPFFLSFFPFFLSSFLSLSIFLLNLLGLYWLVKLHRFQVHNFIIYQLYIVLFVHQRCFSCLYTCPPPVPTLSAFPTRL